MLRRPGGEFRARALEDAFVAENMAENGEHARLLLIAFAVLNTLFVVGDWRFHGTPHFWVVLSARAVVIAAAIVGLFMLHRIVTAAGRHRLMAGWMAVTACGIAALVGSHSEVAMFVVIMLPMIYYLAVPLPFAWTMAGGIGCSLLLLASYDRGTGLPDTSLGVWIAMLILNVALMMIVARSNRMQRLAWLATRAERRTSAELAGSRTQMEKMFSASPVPMIITARADGRITRFNDSAIEFLNAGGRTIDPSNAANFYVDAEDRQRLLALIDRDSGVRDFEMRVFRGDGAIRTVLIKANVVELAGETMIMSGIIDITDRKDVERNLERLASTDPLTGLANRHSFFAIGRDELAAAARRERPVALLMLDLDHFKHINDGHGHFVGDETLRSFALTCREVLADRGIVARLGGEEFGVILPDADLDQAMEIAEALRRTVERTPIRIHASTIRLTASIGVAMIDPLDRGLDRALARADAALYAAKRGGRNRVVAEAAPPVRRAV